MKLENPVSFLCVMERFQILHHSFIHKSIIIYLQQKQQDIYLKKALAKTKILCSFAQKQLYIFK